MAMPEDLLRHLERQTGLPRPRLEALVREVVAYYDETPEEFVRRRHRMMQSEGMKNTEIFDTLAQELQSTRFRAGEYSDRQLRRIVYG